MFLLKQYSYIVIVCSSFLTAKLFDIGVSRGQFHQHFTSSFYVCRSQKRKKYSKVVSLFWSFRDLRTQKLLVERWWNWPQVAFCYCFSFQMVVMTYYTLYTMNFEHWEVWKGKDVAYCVVVPRKWYWQPMMYTFVHWKSLFVNTLLLSTFCYYFLMLSHLLDDCLCN